MVVGLCATVIALLAIGWAARHRSGQSIERASITAESIVMLGDSITEQGPWDVPFATGPIVNRGYHSLTTAQLVDVAREIAVDEPSAIYILAGTNDIRDGHPPEWTLEHYAQILDELDSGAPATTVVIQTILPRQDLSNEVLATNLAIRELAAERGIEVLELHAVFDDGSGGLRAEDTTDGLHLTETGNRRWADFLRSELSAP